MSYLHLTELRLDSVTFRYRQYVGQNLERIAKETLLDSILAFARASGVEKQYAQNLTFVQDSWLTCHYELDWQGPKGEPLGIWYEYGTKAHIIRARVADVLRWIDKRTGKPRFAKWVRHPGTKGHHIMEQGEKFGLPRLEDKITSEINQFLQETKMT